MEPRGKKMEASVKMGCTPERNELSMHSEGLADNNEQEGSDKFFSFNQSFTNIEHNDKLIQEKTNSLHKIRALEDEVKSCKSRSTLWEKAKAQILSLNEYLRLSALSLGCSDSAILREFFQAVRKIVSGQAGKEKDEKRRLEELSRNNNDMFEKLVEANKLRYELEQELVNCRHNISQLSDINTSLREKSRVQSTERSSKIQQFHQETILTIHQKELELTTLEERNDDLRQQICQLEDQLSSLTKKVDLKEDELHQMSIMLANVQAELRVSKGELEEERRKGVDLRNSSEKSREQQKQTENEITEIKEYLKNIVEENIQIRTELTRRADLIAELRKIINEAKIANQSFIQEQTHQTALYKEKEQERIAALLQEEFSLKTNLKANLRFNINSPKKHRSNKKVPTKHSINLPSEELLI